MRLRLVFPEGHAMSKDPCPSDVSASFRMTALRYAAIFPTNVYLFRMMFYRFYRLLRYTFVLPSLLVFSGAFAQTDFRSLVAVLASPEMGGRYPGSRADSLVRKMIADRFEAYGLVPVPALGSFDQKFRTPYRYYFTGEITLRKNGRVTDVLRNGEDFSFHASCGTETLTLVPAFGGFLAVDPTAEIGLDNTACLLYRLNLPQFRPMSEWIGRYGKMNDDGYLADAGVRAALCVDPPEYPPRLDVYSGHRDPRGMSIGLAYPAFERIVGRRRIRRYGRSVSARKLSAPILLKDMTMTIACRKHESFLSTGNVVGLKPGAGRQCIVIGAHHDHIGIRRGEVCPGANDNASGTAMLLELAKRLAERRTQCDILFVAFGAEERKLAGSHYFWEHLPVERVLIRAMINLDMVGGMKDGLFYCQTGAGFDDGERICREALAATGDSLRMEEASAENSGASDNYVFEINGVPTLYFHTGIAGTSLHTPRDTAERIDYEGMERLLPFLENLVLTLDRQESPD